jgi:hypothetical protein
MLPVEMRLKRLERSLFSQRLLNLGLLGLFAGVFFADQLPAAIGKVFKLHSAPAPIIAAAPAPVRAHQELDKREIDIDHIKTRRLSVTDSRGRERMTLLVDLNNSPFVIIKDEEGNYRATLAVQIDGRGAVALWNHDKQAVYGALEQRDSHIALSQK